MSLSFVLVNLALFVLQSQASGYDYEYAEGCDRVKLLRLNESFTVSAFPPYAQQINAYDPLRNMYRAPRGTRECTWVFQSRSRDCQLEFHQRVSAYVRGDILCDRQYFLLGDENREKRFCGFKKPRRRLNSTGTRLFMTHFARDGHDTIASRMSGVVRCAPLSPSPGACVPKPLSCSRMASKPCSHNGDCFIWLRLSDNPDAGVQVETDTIICNQGTGSTCQNTGQMCFETVPVNSTVPVLPAVPPIAGVTQCADPVQITCDQPGNCTGNFLVILDQVPVGDINEVNLTCIAEPECTCVFQGNACFSSTTN